MCRSQTRACNNGTLSGTYTSRTCSVGSCEPIFSVTPGGIVNVSFQRSSFIPVRKWDCSSGTWYYNSTSVIVWNYGGGRIQFTASTPNEWIALNLAGHPRIESQKTVTYTFGPGVESVALEANVKACMPVGSYSGNVTVTAKNADTGITLSGSPDDVKYNLVIEP
jgi:hypothetical protein